MNIDLKLLVAYFTNHPKCDEFHITSDGLAFFTDHDAAAHARSLSDKTVKKFTRTEVEAFQRMHDQMVDVHPEAFNRDLNNDLTGGDKKEVATGENADSNPDTTIDGEDQGGADETLTDPLTPEEVEAAQAQNLTKTEVTKRNRGGRPRKTETPAA